MSNKSCQKTVFANMTDLYSEIRNCHQNVWVVIFTLCDTKYFVSKTRGKKYYDKNLWCKFGIAEKEKSVVLEMFVITICEISHEWKCTNKRKN